MMVRTAMREGRAVSARAARIAASIASRSFPSWTVCVCQPSPSNRRGTSSENESAAFPASDTWLSS